MAGRQKPVRIIQKEDAVFKLDKNGKWHIDGRKFTNPKIVNHFHSMIKKDRDGYFLEQEHAHFIEKVYFPYEDTPLFVFRVMAGEPLILSLNTGETLALAPDNLMIKDDNLYLQHEENMIKFNEDALLSMAEYLDEVKGQYFFDLGGKRQRIRRME
jgi:hypothetical protein